MMRPPGVQHCMLTPRALLSLCPEGVFCYDPDDFFGGGFPSFSFLRFSLLFGQGKLGNPKILGKETEMPRKGKANRRGKKTRKFSRRMMEAFCCPPLCGGAPR